MADLGPLKMAGFQAPLSGWFWAPPDTGPGSTTLARRRTAIIPRFRSTANLGHLARKEGFHGSLFPGLRLKKPAGLSAAL